VTTSLPWIVEQWAALRFKMDGTHLHALQFHKVCSTPEHRRTEV